ncbi:hypothetical protein HB912_01030 [Listeria aquatica]|uniref:Uncharacterized protein n=1 Tax=Listeria aquatica TaxID=1494960 RepID=A0A841ZLA6_9LIST|nr:hypothetical protein [Listeria aquatica]MBC1520228.1 hypothetical protein [Listeria aquatica]
MKENELREILGIDISEYKEWDDYINVCGQKFIKEYFPFLDDKRPLTSISIYSFYPLLFKEMLFISEEDMKNLIKISHFHFISLFLLDKIYDKQRFLEAFDLLALLDMHCDSKRNVIELMGNSKWLNDINKCYLATKYGLYEEKYRYTKDTKMSLEEIEEYCFSKFSYMKIAIFYTQSFQTMGKRILFVAYCCHMTILRWGDKY